MCILFHWRANLYVFFRPAITLKGGFDHASIHLDRVWSLWAFRGFAKMAAELHDLPKRTLLKPNHNVLQTCRSKSDQITKVLLFLWLLFFFFFLSGDADNQPIQLCWCENVYIHTKAPLVPDTPRRWSKTHFPSSSGWQDADGLQPCCSVRSSPWNKGEEKKKNWQSFLMAACHEQYLELWRFHKPQSCSYGSENILLPKL